MLMSPASQAGRDYEPLRAALAEGDFEKADDITRDELIQLAGPGAVKRSWVYFSGAWRPLHQLILTDCTASETTCEPPIERRHTAGSLRATWFAACSLHRADGLISANSTPLPSRALRHTLLLCHIGCSGCLCYPCCAEVKFIPEQDMRTIDALWRAASDGKFGYGVQKEIWMQQSKYWSRFFKKIEWVQVCFRNWTERLLCVVSIGNFLSPAPLVPPGSAAHIRWHIIVYHCPPAPWFCECSCTAAEVGMGRRASHSNMTHSRLQAIPDADPLHWKPQPPQDCAAGLRLSVTSTVPHLPM